MNKKFLIKKINESGYRFMITINTDNHKIILKAGINGINCIECEICKAMHYEKIYNKKRHNKT